MRTFLFLVSPDLAKTGSRDVGGIAQVIDEEGRVCSLGEGAQERGEMVERDKPRQPRLAMRC